MSEQLDENEQLANRYYLSFKDMQDAERYLRACQELTALRKSSNDPNIYADHCEGLLSAAIVAYCRPFVESNSTGFAKACLGKRQLASFRAHQELHKLLIQKRNQIIAHSDWEHRQTEIFHIDDERTVVRVEPIPYIADGIPLDEFLSLIVSVGNECRQKTYLLDTGGMQARGKIVSDGTI